MDYLVVNRMFYDPARGLLRDCKNPQQSDTALRKYWSKEKLEAEKKSNSSADIGEASSSPVETQKPKRAAVKPSTSTAKSTAKAPIKTKRRKPNVVIVKSESDSSDPSESEESDDEMPVLPPKRSRAGRAVPGNTKPDVAQMAASTTATTTPASNGFMDMKQTLPDPLPTPPSVQALPSVAPTSTQAAVVNPDSSAFAGSCLSYPATANNNSNAIMQLLVSTTYDIALNSARQQELERRERECAARERMHQENTEKECFLRKAAEVLKALYPGSNF